LRLPEIVAVPGLVGRPEIAGLIGKSKVRDTEIGHGFGVDHQVIGSRKDGIGGDIGNFALAKILPEFPTGIGRFEVRLHRVVERLDGAGAEPQAINLKIVADHRLPGKSGYERDDAVDQRCPGEGTGSRHDDLHELSGHPNERVGGADEIQRSLYKGSNVGQ
jgi:hypothetical protein